MDRLAAFFDLEHYLLVLLVFVPLERLLPERKGQPLFRPGWKTDFLHLLFSGLLIRAGLVALLLFGLALRPAVPAGFREAVAAQPLWLQLAEVVLLADLGFYWVHRLFHAVPALWRFHAVHHSIEDMDWLAGHRVHPVDQIFTRGAALVPCFALGFSVWALVAFGAIYRWHSLLLHANVRLSFGRFDRVIASPAFHHWHHGKNEEVWDCNFAGQLSFLDLLFGTARLPQGAPPKAYGTETAVPVTYLGQLAAPFAARRPRSVTKPL